MTAASLTLGLGLIAFEASASTAARPVPPPTVSKDNLKVRYSQAHAAGYDMAYYRIIAEQCGALTSQERIAQKASADARLFGLRGELKDAFFWNAIDKGKADAQKDAYETEGELCTCRNPSNFYNLSLACDLN